MKDLDFYSIISQIWNELEDDLTLDLGKGETGYDSYEESYKAVKHNSLKKIKKLSRRMERRIHMDAKVEADEQ